MLHLYIGRRKDYFLSGDGVFDFNFDCSYLLTDFSKKVIKAIDKSEVVDKNVIVSPILGGIAPSFLAGSTKTLLMLMYTDYKFYLEAMGDNCLPFLKYISDQKDIFMCTTTIRPLFIAGFTKFYVENTNEIVTDVDRYIELEIEYGGDRAC